ncbi:MAG: hypothetical protein RLZZ15_2510 [Verrucomicrobiota bacterium]
MKSAVATPSRRPTAKVTTTVRRNSGGPGKRAPKAWTPPDFQRWLQEDFGGKIRPISYADFLER